MLPRDIFHDPPIETFLALAQRAFDDLPDEVRLACGRVVFRVAEYADRRTLRSVDLDDPMELSGLYVGSSILPELANHGSTHVPEVWLYRQPILAEWRDRGDVTLDDLVAHVLIHEIAHHFGYDDDEIDWVQAD